MATSKAKTRRFIRANQDDQRVATGERLELPEGFQKARRFDSMRELAGERFNWKNGLAPGRQFVRPAGQRASRSEVQYLIKSEMARRVWRARKVGRRGMLLGENARSKARQLGSAVECAPFSGRQLARFALPSLALPMRMCVCLCVFAWLLARSLARSLACALACLPGRLPGRAAAAAAPARMSASICVFFMRAINAEEMALSPS